MTTITEISFTTLLQKKCKNNKKGKNLPLSNEKKDLRTVQGEYLLEAEHLRLTEQTLRMEIGKAISEYNNIRTKMGYKPVDVRVNEIYEECKQFNLKQMKQKALEWLEKTFSKPINK